MIWAVVLAAGESRRMGRPKLLLPYGKETIIENVVRTVVGSNVDGTLVVLGAGRRGIEEKIRRFPVVLAVNREYGKGMFSSVLCGLGKLPKTARGAVLVLADQPGIPSRVIDSLIGSFHREKKGLVVPVFGEKRGHPLLLDLKYRREVECLPADVGLRGLLQRHPEDVREVRVSSPEILRDIDSPGDYCKATEGEFSSREKGRAR